VVLDYCAAVRGILNDDQGGPCIHRVCAWPRPWRTCTPRCSGIGRRKKGADSRALCPFSRRHRTRADGSA
jgi:hypothetical protein